MDCADVIFDHSPLPVVILKSASITVEDTENDSGSQQQKPYNLRKNRSNRDQEYSWQHIENQENIPYHYQVMYQKGWPQVTNAAAKKNISQMIAKASGNHYPDLWRKKTYNCIKVTPEREVQDLRRVREVKGLIKPALLSADLWSAVSDFQLL